MPEGETSGFVYPERPMPSGLITDAWKGRRWKPDGTDVFCGDRSNQPETLFETRNLFVVPDLFPVTPGHILILPKRHYPAFGATPVRWDREVERTLQRVQQFVRDAYGLEAVVWENGGPAAGQSVHHAHLHVIPMPPTVTALPPPTQAFTLRVRGLAEVRAWFRSERGGRPYHIFALGNDRRLLPAGSPDVGEANDFKGTVLQMEKTPDGRRWVRRRNPAEVARTVALFRAWETTHPSKDSPPPSSIGGVAA